MFKLFPNNISSIISIVFDGITIILLMVIAITSFLFQDKRQNTIRRLMLSCTLFGILSAASDIIYILIYSNFETANLFDDFSMINASVLALFLLVKSNFTYYYINNEKKSNYSLKVFSAIFAAILIITSLVPIFSSVFGNLPTIVGANINAPLRFVYMITLFLLEFTSLIAIIINFNNLALQNSIVLGLFQVLPVIVFIVSGEVIAPALFFMAVFLLLAYIILFQGGTIESYRQEKEIAQMNIINKEMSTKLLVSQIQPHFLYNTLSSIAYYCKKDPDVAEKLTHDFSSYLRSNIDSLDGESLITFDHELDHVKTYLNIEKIRFGERINDSYDIKVKNFTLPSLSLQPIVENAVKHGLCKKEDGGTVTLSTYYDGDFLVIKIVDNGVGFDTSKTKEDGRSHVGIENVRERLQLLCNASLIVESNVGEGTAVTIRIPREVQV